MGVVAGMKPKRKADELEMLGSVQDEQVEDRGRRKQVKQNIALLIRAQSLMKCCISCMCNCLL